LERVLRVGVRNGVMNLREAGQKSGGFGNGCTIPAYKKRRRGGGQKTPRVGGVAGIGASRLEYPGGSGEKRALGEKLTKIIERKKKPETRVRANKRGSSWLADKPGESLSLELKSDRREEKKTAPGGG